MGENLNYEITQPRVHQVQMITRKKYKNTNALKSFLLKKNVLRK